MQKLSDSHTVALLLCNRQYNEGSLTSSQYKSQVDALNRQYLPQIYSLSEEISDMKAEYDYFKNNLANMKEEETEKRIREFEEKTAR